MEVEVDRVECSRCKKPLKAGDEAGVGEGGEWDKKVVCIACVREIRGGH